MRGDRGETLANEGRGDQYRWVALAIATFAQAGACFLVQGLGALGAQMQTAFSASASEIGLLVSAAQFTPILGLMIAGALLDRSSERLVVGVGASMTAGAIFLASQARSYCELLLWLVVVSFGYSTVQPGGGKVVAAWFPASSRGFAMGVRQAGLPLGAALATLFLPRVADAFGWRAAFLLGGAVALAGGAGFAALYRPPAGAAAPVAERVDARRALAARLPPLRLRAMPRIVWPGVTMVTLQFALSIYLPLDLRDRFALPIETGVALLFAAQGAGVVGRIALAAWSDRSGRGRAFTVAASMVAMIAGVLAYLAAPGWPTPALAALALWLGFFGFGWYGPWIALVAEAAPRGQVGFMIGLAMAINQVAVVAGPPLFGWLRDASGSYVYGWIALCGGLALALWKTARLRED
jgi:MFS family permease